MRTIQGPVTGIHYTVKNELSKHDRKLILEKVRKMEKLIKESDASLEKSEKYENKTDEKSVMKLVNNIGKAIKSTQEHKKILDELEALEMFAIQNCIVTGDSDVRRMDKEERTFLFDDLFAHAVI